MKEQIKTKIYDFFIKSNDFNGIPIRRISNELEIDYKESIEIIKELVRDDVVSIQATINPFIIGIQHYPVEKQIEILDEAKESKEVIKEIGSIKLVTDSSGSTICVYPSINYLQKNRDLSDFGNAVYTKRLALGEPHLKPVFFEIEVLERYANDPRFEFKFEDYSGNIYCKYDENDNPIVREEDQIFLKTFGLGFDDENNRVAVVYLRYLKDLTNEHQVFWNSKEALRESKMLKEYYENTIQGKWTFSYSIFSAFLGELKCLNEISEEIFEKPLFRKTFENEKRPREFTFFFTPTLKNYNSFVLLLDKMISDNINKDFFKDKVDLVDLVEVEKGVVEKRNKGTLRLFEEWFLSNYNAQDREVVKEVFKPFKKVRKQRQSPAHRINENEYDKKYFEKQNKLIDEAYSSMRAFRIMFHQHPKARQIEIPDWLENGEIKSF